MPDKSDIPAVEWVTSNNPVAYDEAVAFMEQRAADIRAGSAAELIWLLTHPALVTAGTSAKEHDLLQPGKFPVHQSGRGGQYTYHGPGQRVIYVMLDLNRRGRDVRGFVRSLEKWVMDVLFAFELCASRYDDRVGVWVPKQQQDGAGTEAKIAAIGIRVRKWVSYHGISINLDPDLSHFEAIIPCGISELGVTSFTDLGMGVTMKELDKILRDQFEKAFGKTVTLQSLHGA